MKEYGWKTITGAILVGLSSGLAYVGEAELSAMVYDIGVSLGLIGLGHKAVKLSRKIDK